MSSVMPTYEQLRTKFEEIGDDLAFCQVERESALMLWRNTQDELAKAKAELEAERSRANALQFAFTKSHWHAVTAPK